MEKVEEKSSSISGSGGGGKMTPAELAFKRMQVKRVRVLEKVCSLTGHTSHWEGSVWIQPLVLFGKLGSGHYLHCLFPECWQLPQ